jgi:hypothetical protein
MNVVHPLTFRRTLYFNNGSLLIKERLEQCTGDVFNLYFTRKECRVVSRKGVGAKPVIILVYGPTYLVMYLQDGEVWEIMYIGAHVRLCPTMLIPLLIQGLALFSDDFHWRQELLYLEAGGQDDYVELVFRSVNIDDAGLIYRTNTFWYNIEIRGIEGVEVIRVEDTALAT